MRKIDILTYWGVPNYGAWIQAYALNNTITQIARNMKQNIKIRHINWLEESHWKYYYEKDERLCNAFMYNWQQIPHTHQYTEEELEKEEFDICITGSDSIWSFIETPKPDFYLIGNKIKAKHLCAYAASAGTSSVQDICHMREVIEGFDKYDLITVRDEKTGEIVNHFSKHHRINSTVLDPALLWDFKKDKEVLLPQYSDYIVVYGTQWTEAFIEEIKALANKQKLKLISVGFINPWCDINLKMIELRTKEWLGFFCNAEYVVTSTFHGLMVGLAYEKQIKFCQVPFVKNRSETLIKKLGLEDWQSNKSDIDYNKVSLKLQKERKKSLDVLESILEL